MVKQNLSHVCNYFFDLAFHCASCYTNVQLITRKLFLKNRLCNKTGICFLEY